MRKKDQFSSSPLLHLSISPSIQSSFSLRNFALFILHFAFCICTPAWAAENFFIVWGPIFHEDQTLCAHRPQDPHYPLPNQTSYVAYFQGRPDILITERSPKWNIRDDPTVPGNGFYGVEVGSLHRSLDSHSDTLVVILTCEATNQQVNAHIHLKDFELGHQQFSLNLQHEILPESPRHLEITRKANTNVLLWPSSPGSTYDLYRTDLSDTLADGRPERVYQRLTGKFAGGSFIDDTIDPAGHYGYILIPQTTRGEPGAHTPESVDIPIEEGPISRLALFSTGNVAVSHAGNPTVSILNPQGRTTSTLGVLPRSVFSTDRQDNLWIVGPSPASPPSSWRASRIPVSIYSSGGTLLDTFSLAHDGNLQGEIRDADLDRRGRLWLLTDSGLYVFNRQFGLLALRELETGSESHPISITLFRGRIAVTDPVARKVRLFRFRRHDIVPAGTISTPSLEPWDVQWVRSSTLAVSDPFKKTVSIYDITGNELGSLDTDMVGSLVSPRDMQRGRRFLYVADYNRVVLLPTGMDMSRFSPKISFGEPGEATLSWRSAIPTPTWIRYWPARPTKVGAGGPERQEPRIVEDRRITRNHRITLEELPPVSRINFSVSSPLRTIPPRTWSEPLDFATPLWERGKTAILRLPLAVILHTHAVDLSEQPRDHPPTVPIPPDEVNQIRKQIDDAVLFYWHNSSMKVFLDVDFFASERFLDVAPFGEHPPPDPDEIETFLSQQDRNLSEYVGVARIIAEQRYDSDVQAWVMAGTGGGFTWGINPIEQLPGASWWRATPASEGSGNDWLMTHEFHHQLDAAFHESDHTEYPFNHFSPLEYAGPFGEHYDGNAYILRQWEDRDWFLLKWGDVMVMSDADEDGIPDDEPRLPSDEKRLGSDPGSKDSDGDGLQDLEEVLLSNWVTAGVGEDWGGPIHLPDLTGRDTDGDGLPDGKDPYPLYDLDPDIPRFTPTIDGILEETEWSPFFHLKDERGEGEFFLSWDGDFLYGAARIRPAAPFQLQIDAKTDGWFIGRDNIVVRFSPDPEIPRPEVDAKVFVCDEEPERYPYMNTDLIHADSIRAAGRTTNGEWSLEFAIPRLPDLGLTLHRGQRIGINAGYYFDSSLRRRVSLFEPHRLILLTLTR